MHWGQVRVRNGIVAHGLDIDVAAGRQLRELQEGTFVVAGVQVVGSAEDGQELRMVPAKARRLDLVRPDDALQVVLRDEGLRDIRPEHVDSLPLSVRWAVAVAAAGVAPKDVDQRTFVVHIFLVGGRSDGTGVGIWRDLNVTIHLSYLIEVCEPHHRDGICGIVRLAWHPNAWIRPWKAAVQDQDLLLHQVAEWQVPEGFRKQIEQAHVVLRAHLATEAVEDVGLKHLVVPTVQKDMGRVFQLEGKDGHDHLNGPRATVHEVTVEHEWRVRGWAPCQLE
mmetsp:Transcript_20817/g.67506  ORF Transcript_20817/g.67506 Transcript_20817/m.67506 type:complete len:279 (-) Transcript_20817:744-1580(-)